MPKGFTGAAALLPMRIRAAAERLNAEEKAGTEEFRLRAGRPPTVLTGDGERRLAEEGVTEQELRAVVEAATRSSYHSAADALRRGYLPAAGGVRVGVCGSAVNDGTIRGFRELSSVAIRVPRQIRKAGEHVIGAVAAESVLVVSPPGAGKTTFLRELVRTVSDGGTRISLADERGELAACVGGLPQFDVGRCTDVLSGADKAEAVMLLLRAMNPEVIALDEISAPQDAEAVLLVAGCGVRVFATAHAPSVDALRRRAVYRPLLEAGVFTRAVVIRRGAVREYRVEAL